MKIKEMLNLAHVPSILMLGAVYVAYVLIGGVVFWRLEGDLVNQKISRVLQRKNNLLMEYTCLDQEGLEVVAQVRITSYICIYLYIYSRTRQHSL